MLLLILGDKHLVTFTDLHDNFEYYRHPLQVIKKEDIALQGYVSPSTHFYKNGWVRPVIMKVINESTKVETRYYLELVFYVLPTGAAAITLGTKAAGVYTATNSGLFIDELGTITATSSLTNLVAGLLFERYYKNPSDNRGGNLDGVVTTLNPGDGIWIIRNGDVILQYSGGAPADKVPLICSTTVAGKVEAGANIDTSSVVNLNTTLKQHVLGASAPDYGLAAANARGAGSGGFVAAKLFLGPRPYMTTV